jgi:exportin-1
MFVDKCEDLDLLAQRLVPALIDPILGDYARSVPDARWVTSPRNTPAPLTP